MADQQPGSQFWGTGMVVERIRSSPDKAAAEFAKLSKKDQAKKVAADKKTEKSLSVIMDMKIKEKGQSDGNRI